MWRESNDWFPLEKRTFFFDTNTRSKIHPKWFGTCKNPDFAVDNMCCPPVFLLFTEGDSRTDYNSSIHSKVETIYWTRAVFEKDYGFWVRVPTGVQCLTNTSTPKSLLHRVPRAMRSELKNKLRETPRARHAAARVQLTKFSMCSNRSTTVMFICVLRISKFSTKFSTTRRVVWNTGPDINTGPTKS